MVYDGVLLGFLTLAGVLAGAIFLVSVIVYARRRSRRYLLLTAALGALFGRSLVGLCYLVGWISHRQHHLIEHGLDIVIGFSILAALIVMGRPTSTVEGPTQ